MKLLLLALLVGVCYSAPSAPEMSAGFGTVEEGPENVVDNGDDVDHYCQAHAKREKDSSGCPPTCQYPQSTCMVLINGYRCVCEPGYVLNGNEECIKLEDCPNYNPDENLGFNDGLEEPQVIDSVEPGVAADDAEEDFQLLAPSNTEACAANQVYNECGSACPKTCAKPEGSLICEQMCVIGCQCEEGFYMTSEKTCVKLDDCF